MVQRKAETGAGTLQPAMKPPLIIRLSCLSRIITAVGVVSLLLVGPAAGAAPRLHCEAIAGHRVCLESIQRSAKYIWEYRAVISVDGTLRPVQRYDCRPSSGALNPPVADQVAEADLRQFVCGLVR